MNLSRRFFLLFVCLLSLNIVAQKTDLRREIDSLKLLVKNASENEKVDLYQQLFIPYRGYNLDSAEIFAKKSLQLALELKNTKKIGYAHLYMGIMQFDRTRNYESLESLKKSLEIGIDIKDSILISKSYRTLASTYSNLGNFNLSIQNIFKALPMFEKLNDEFEIGNTYTELASNLHRNKKFEDALTYNKKALTIFINIDNKIRQAVTYNNMSNNLNGLKQYKQSIINSKKADSLFKNLGYERFTAYTKGNMAIAYDSLKQFDKAEKLYNTAIKIHNENDEFYELSFLQNALANLYLKKNNYSKALEVANIALSNALKVDALEFETYSNKTLGELYKKTNIPQKASYHFEKYAILKDSLFKIEERKSQLELKEQYEAATKEKEIAQQKEELLAQELIIKNRNLYALIITSILLILGIIYYAFYKRNQLKRQQLETEITLKDELAKITTQNKLQEQRLSISRDLHDNIGSQLTFIISSLDNLKMISKQTDEKLKDKIGNISSFTSQTIHELRDTIWAMNKNEISLEDLQARILSFNQKAKSAVPNINFAIENTIETNQVFISVVGINIFRVIQEAINNAIKYADAKNININLTYKNQVFIASVIDDGKGFDLQNVTLGNGLSNMEKRMSEIGGKVIINSKVNFGTTITLQIQNKATDV